LDLRSSSLSYCLFALHLVSFSLLKESDSDISFSKFTEGLKKIIYLNFDCRIVSFKYLASSYHIHRHGL